MLKPLTVWITTNWKILKEMGIADHLTYLLRNLYAGQEATVRIRHETMNWFKIRKGVCQGCILSPSLFNLYAECIMKNARLNESQAKIKIARTCRWRHPKGRKRRGSKKPLDEGERSENSTFKKLRSWHPVPPLHSKWRGESVNNDRFSSPESLQIVTSAMKLKDACSLEKKLWQT